MSCTTRKTVWEKIDVVVGEDLQDSLLEIISKGEKCLEQKFSKLNLLLKNMNVYYCKEHVVVNDRYGACADFKEIAQAFGFKTIETKLSLRGKNYLLTDEIIKILCQLDEKFSLVFHCREDNALLHKRPLYNQGYYTKSSCSLFLGHQKIHI